MMMENYLQVLEESLHKKMNVLCKIEEANIRQEKILRGSRVEADKFEDTIEEKGKLIEELNKLDDGFENLYAHIKEQLASGRERYKLQIAGLQKLIAEVTDKSVKIQAQEARNKQLAEQFFITSRRELQKGRQSSRAALNYYQSMNNSQMVEAQFMDQKKIVKK